MKRARLPVARAALIAAALAAFPLAGCSLKSPQTVSALPLQPGAMEVYDGTTGAVIGWDKFHQRAREADVIILGEQHDDAAAHLAQQMIVRTMCALVPDMALSMEMLERDEQPIVDDYLAGLIDRDRFIEETASTRWRSITAEFFAGDISADEFERKVTAVGWPDWERNYQPMIDTVKACHSEGHTCTVIAANAPWMRYTSLITREAGYTPLESLSPTQRALIAWPDEAPSGRYRERFWQFMAGRKEGEPAAPRPALAANDPHSGEFTDDQVLTGFMKQLLYDATMADSIARALDAGASKVVHLVGQFHSDFEGGTVIELNRRAPAARVLTVTFVSESDGASLRDEDKRRADVVIYTGR